jgi:hypothetical protein
MHKCTVFQMCYLAVLLMKKVKEQTNVDTLKKIYAKTMTQALTDQQYKDGAKVNFMQAYDELFDLLKESSDKDDAMESLERDLDIEQVLQGEPNAAGINKLAAKCPTNIKEPNFSRWGTISAVCKVVLEHWLPLSFMAQNIIAVEKQQKKSGSYLCVIATSLLALMSSKSDPTQSSPTHYTSLRWLVAFGESFFDAHMEWAKRHDPVFGVGSHGHISRLVPEHLYLMHRQFEELKNDGWKTKPEFAGFLKAVDGVNEKGEISNVGKEYFQRLPSVFLDKFEETFKEHTKKWRSAKTLPIVIAGHPRIAKAYLRWLFDKDPSPDETVVLEHHYNGMPVSISVNQCISWLTERTNTEDKKTEMEYNPLIQDLIDELAAYIDCEDDSVDLLDPTTFEHTPFKDQFKRIEEFIWNAIAPRAAHQQRVENLVQTAGHLGKTNIGEARRSARARIHSIFYRDFNQWSLNIERKRDEEKAAANPNLPIKKKRDRVRGARLFELKVEYTTKLLNEMDIAINSLEERTPGIMKTIATELSIDNKSSAVEIDQKYNRYLAASNAAIDRVLSSKNMADVTSWMNGSVILNYLTQKAGAIPFIVAELEHRGVEYYLDPEKTEAELRGKDLERHQHGLQTGKWSKQSIAWLKRALKFAEHSRLGEVAKDLGPDVAGPKLSDVTEVEPLSEELKQWLPKQWEIYKQRNGQVHEGGDSNI